MPVSVRFYSEEKGLCFNVARGNDNVLALTKPKGGETEHEF